MCGIVGFVGDRAATPVLLEGLRRMEYRGYDSAGVALSDGARIEVVKSVGRVECLASEMHKGQHPETCGIAHTRWATHGAPSVRNAHPHLDGKNLVAVVHNGIVENYAELRKALEKRGVVFRSDTDSEVIPNLIAALYDGDPIAAVVGALRQLKGTYGIAVLFADHPEMLIAARCGSPVIVGHTDSCGAVASDIHALTGVVEQAIYLEDGDLAIISGGNVELRNLENELLARNEVPLDGESSAIDKGEFDHYMLKEIFEQPTAVAQTISGRILPEEGNAKLSGLGLSPRELAAVSRVVIAGCGSSLHAGLVGVYYLEDIAGIPASVEQAAEFRYRNPIIQPNTLVVAISQSGETADTLAAVREAKQKGALVAAISNVVGSTIARECGAGIYLHAGAEISVASTKAFTAQVTALYMLALRFGRNRHLGANEGRRFAEEIQHLPALINRMLSQADAIRRIAESVVKCNEFFFIGRGPLYPVALEGALKLKEISYVHAEGYHAAELKHGPIALLGENVPVIALANDIPGKDKLLGNLAECRARKSPVIAVATEGDDEVKKLVAEVIEVPKCSRYAAPIVTAVALQLLAYYFAKARGCEIDQPRHLAKSVTVE